MRRETGLVRPAALLAVFAHPDDEAFRPGGTLALLAGRGVRVHVVTATRGDAGSRGDPPLCTPEELPAVREHELSCACAALGIQPPRLLDYHDGHLSEANPEQVIARILQVVRQVGPQVLLTFGPDGLSGHPDHIAIGRWAEEAFQRSETVGALYTVAVPQSLATRLGMPQVRAVPDRDIAVTVDVSSVWEAKMAAIRCHATQLSSSPILSATDERLRMFLGMEYFVCAHTRGATPTVFDQLNTK
jgi:N-acetyl-1-D-myo-inositol-2-amino-2-deoxy-alpha-D-glucopyranoside deacetylase